MIEACSLFPPRRNDPPGGGRGVIVVLSLTYLALAGRARLMALFRAVRAAAFRCDSAT